MKTGTKLKAEADMVQRKNISLTPAILRMGKELQIERGDSDFSAFLTTLIKEERQRRQPRPGIQSSTAPRKFDERVAEVVETLMEDFKGYMAKCVRDNPKTGGKSAMFEAWALQRLASLVVRGLEIDERIADLEGSSRR